MKRMRIIAILGLAVMVSAVTVIYVRHQNRLAFMLGQVQQDYRDELDIEWRRMMLERATWSAEHTVAMEVRKKQKMHSPPPEEIVTLKFAGEVPGEIH